MNKVPRFVQEYANFQKRTLDNYDLMRPEIKQAGIDQIDGAVKALKRGLITIDEAMNLIMNWHN